MSDGAPAATLHELMRTQRAIRRLRKEPIPDAVLERILVAGALAPSGGNVQPWRVVVVRDAGLRKAIGDLYRPQWAKYGAGSRKGLSALQDDARAKQERMLEAADYLGEHMGDAPVILVVCFNPGHMAITDANLGRPSVVGGGSVYPAVQNMMLAARAEGVGCVLTTLLCFEENAMKNLLRIPPEWHTCGVIPLGFPERGGYGPTSRRPVKKLAYGDRWGESIKI
ncbi:MAG: nitroreductase family protein [Gammaproteobacteria bacterium]|nr:nitroreductase family protein [Gammaproteobacteria bacterium]